MNPTIIIEKKPTWLELPDESPGEYWSVEGELYATEPYKPAWVTIFTNKEDAEEDAKNDTLSMNGWTWDGKPALLITLAYALANARYYGDLGVQVCCLINGERVVLKKYPANIPIEEI